ncbi:MAG: amidohydrolase [Longimicrobiales bacterium]|nr:amidohydrolase [Longimicrobiales bacterium]
MNRRTVLTLALAAALAPSALAAQSGKATVAAYIDRNAERFGEVAQSIWDFAEVGYMEVQSSALLQATLREAGFTVEAGVAAIPTAFVASWSNGDGPVIGILAEFDALPGITQDRSPQRAPLEEKPAGHACGHHLFGTGSTAAAMAVKDWMGATGQKGTIRLYGTPAEEGGAGKVYMVREGLFEDVDVVLHWHAGDRNAASSGSSLANKSAKFRFRGVSAHAAGSPERGRSALDGVEAMNHMVNLMREHVPQETRIHYVITYGGAAPNVVPDFSEVFYYVRNPDPANVASIFERVVKAAEGAALGTGVEMDYEVIHGIYNLLPNIALQKAIYANLEQVGGVLYDDQEWAFADLLRKSLPEDAPPLERAAQIEPFTVTEEGSGGSTDVADVSWVVPTGGMRAATWVPGTAAHSWQAVAAGGTTIGEKGLVVAAKTLAMTAVDLFTNPALVAEVKAERLRRVGPDFVYKSLVGDRAPPLDYRKPAGPGGS